MPDVNQLFRAATQNARPAPGALARQLETQRRQARNRKMRVLAVAAVVAAIALFAATELNRGKDGSAPASTGPSRSALSLTVVGLDGSIQRFLPWRPEGTLHPDVSPDGTSVAFVIQYGPESQIATMRLDGTGFRLVTSDAISADRPRWSPDGERLLFYEGIGLRHRRLMVMDADGTHLREIEGTRRPENVPPDWSPDGSLILYTSMVYGRRDLAIVPSAGGRSVPITATPHVEEGPGTWSPDGSSIAYTLSNSHRSEIWVMNADGSGTHRLVTLPLRDAAAPEWSPDGTKIAFIGFFSSARFKDGSNADNLYVVDVATGEVSVVLEGIADFEEFDSRATWLPDSDALLVLTETP